MIIKKYEAKQVNEGAGVIVTRVFGFHELNDFDPFLMLDYFDHEDTLNSPGFPWHPHKGIETISYILRGEIEHQDTLGNKGVIGAGELQWMTAGKGIKHKEMPVRSEEGLEGFQFWVNLPRDKKLVEPKYQYMTNETLKVVKTDDYEVRIISGDFEGQVGPINKDDLGIQMLHVFSKNHVTLERSVDKNGFIFVIRGKGNIGDEEICVMTA
jgi:redox-sensitive bicupin YhaK (pirin superfamily)